MKMAADCDIQAALLAGAKLLRPQEQNCSGRRRFLS